MIQSLYGVATMARGFIAYAAEQPFDLVPCGSVHTRPDKDRPM
ncbi:MAG: hypothetical protein WAT36_05935 [Chromatiaceae bacterium]